MLLLASCDNTQTENEIKEPSAGPQGPDAPQWSPPQVPEYWFTMPLPPDKEEVFQEIPQDIMQKPQPLPERDTIRGIAVRVPGKIILKAEEIYLSGLDSIEKAFYAINYISTNTYFGINFDNDIFSNTDYYYTNGIRFEMVAPIFATSPFAWPMLPYRRESMNYHGITIVQNMYTPTNPDTISVTDGDRPFAAYLYIGHSKNTLSSKKKYRQYSEIVIGLMGPGSLGGLVQSQIHNIEPVGWQNQIQNDLVLNYTAVFEKGLINPRYFDLNIFADAQIGTLYDNLGAGLRLRAGKLNSYFGMPALARPGSAEGRNALNLQYGILAGTRLRAILYDATLQGGAFNRNNHYTIPASDIERLVLQASIGFYFAYRQIGISYEHFYISPEFKNARHHQWGHINLTYCF